ncbi:MAG: Sua5/YciO/YrdC/YwlC family protein [Bacteroidota bacterium]|nr:Sua5/YciO/YrdC/YwlC family protein [Bacteroidota bacterium]
MMLESDIVNCIKTLQEKQLILFPSEIGWLVGADATSDQAVYSLLTAAQENPVTILVASEREVMQHAVSVDLAVFDFIDQSIEPLAVLYDGIVRIAQELAMAHGAIAIHIVRDEFCNNLIKRFKKPIVAFQLKELNFKNAGFRALNTSHESFPFHHYRVIRWPLEQFQ